MGRGIRLLPGEGERIAGPWGGAVNRHKGGRCGYRTHYSLLEFTAAPGAAWSTYHTHPTTEAWYVLEGDLSFRLDGVLLTT
jgi:quercetin dioxygenase-like cupin family protein